MRRRGRRRRSNNNKKNPPKLTSCNPDLEAHDLDPHKVRRRRVLFRAHLVPPPPVASHALRGPAHPAHRLDASVGDGRDGLVPRHRLEAEAELSSEAVPGLESGGGGGGGRTGFLFLFGFFSAALQYEGPERLRRELRRREGRRGSRRRRGGVGVDNDDARGGLVLKHWKEKELEEYNFSHASVRFRFLRRGPLEPADASCARAGSKSNGRTWNARRREREKFVFERLEKWHYSERRKKLTRS